MYISRRVLADANEENYLLVILVFLQTLDANYDSYDLNKDKDLLAYLGKVISCLNIDEAPYEELARVSKIIEDHKSQSNYTPLRNYLVELHGIIGQHRFQEPVETSKKVLSAFKRLAKGLEGERIEPGRSG